MIIKSYLVFNFRDFLLSDEGPSKDESLLNKPVDPIFFLIFEPNETSSSQKCAIFLDQVKKCKVIVSKSKIIY